MHHGAEPGVLLAVQNKEFHFIIHDRINESVNVKGPIYKTKFALVLNSMLSAVCSWAVDEQTTMAMSCIVNPWFHSHILWRRRGAVDRRW